MKIELFKSKNQIKKSRNNINPDFYWAMVFGGGLIATLVVFAFGLYVFTKTNQEFEFTDEAPINQIGNIRKERIDKVLSYFERNKVRSAEIISNSSPVVDPSL